MKSEMNEREETLWCVDCGARFTDEEAKNAFACPKCGSEGIPCDTLKDIRVEINWHELRILGIWAEQWARRCAESGGEGMNGEKMPATVTAITRRLQRQYPDFTPLTMSEEFACLAAELEKAGIQHGGVETNVPRPQPIAVNGPGAVGNTLERILPPYEA